MVPELVELQTKYENYRIAVDRSYSLAAELDLKEVKELVAKARELRPYIAEDLDAGIAMLDKSETSATRTS